MFLSHVRPKIVTFVAPDWFRLGLFIASLSVFSTLLSFDIALFEAINGFNHPFADELMHFVSTRSAWLPSYVLVLWLIWEKEGRNWQRTLLWAGALVVAVVLANTISSEVLKPLVMRLRPCYASLPFDVHIYDGHCGGKYGFVSSHSANFFAMATVLHRYFQHNRASWIVFGCATLVAYSRVYLGVHYPGDVVGGALIGAAAGWLSWAAARQLAARFR